MRLALALLAAVALAGCQVDLDGAACAEPGSAADCPSGQACGNDLRCSARALACAPTRCTPAPGPVFCASPDGAAAERCADADPVCGAVVAEPCSPTIAAALAAAAEHALATAGEITVTLRGRGEGEAVFASESFPLQVPAGVALDGTTAPAGAAVVGAAGPSAALLAVAGIVRGLRVEASDSTGTGVSVACGPAGAPSLADVVVAGGGKLETGIAVSAADCGATLARVVVSGATGPALSVESGPDVPVTVVSSRFSGSGTGIRVTEGKVTVGSDDPADAVEVSGNGGDGVVLTGGAARTLEVVLSRVTVAENGGTGIVLGTVAPTSSVAIAQTELRANGETGARTYGPQGNVRRAGGVLILQNNGVATFSFTGNRVFSNAGDQVGIWSDAPWQLGPATCGAASNALGCTGNLTFAVSVIGNATVGAEFNVWSSSNPEGLVSGAAFNPPCAANLNAAPPAPVCPSP